MAIVGALAACALGCAEPTTTVPKVDPTVTLHPMPRELLADGLTATVEVTGCDRVARVRLRDRDHLLEEVEAQGAVTEINVPSKRIPFAQRGIAADLALFADATCADGRSASSREVPLTFMPSEERLPGPFPFGFNFWVESSGESFLSCTTELVRVSRDREIVARGALNFDCEADAELIFGPDGNIYVVKPGFGFAGFSPQLSLLLAVDAPGIEQLLVPPDPSKPLVALTDNGVLHSLVAFDHADGAPVWGPRYLNGLPGGRLAYQSGRVVYPSYWLRETGGNLVDLGISSYDIDTGTQAALQAMGTMVSDLLGPLALPEIALDASATTAYFADLADPSVVRACDAVDSRGCTEKGQGLLWASGPLIGGVTKAVRTPNGLVAYGSRIAFFLDPASGEVIGDPITPAGSLVFSYVMPAKDGSTLLLAQAAGQAGIKQVLVFDEPGKQVANFVTGTEGYVVDVDGKGRPWLWKHDLVRLFPASQYRMALGE
ncbi:MAG: hypothetical protein ACOX6T_23035 [Myxococcales bacterium]